MISFQNISKEFQNNFWERKYFALKNISFKINEGDLVGFLGANGAGKTTLIKILMGFSQATSGEVKYGKMLGNDSVEIKSSMGYLPERAYLYQHLTGLEFLKYIAKLNNINNQVAIERINEYSSLLKMNKVLDRKISGYSKGMQQRIGFISSIIHNPKLLILDEPLSGLDPIGRQDFKIILKKLNQAGTTIFFSSHVVADVEEICSRVVFLEGGELVYEGSINSILEKHTREEFKISFLSNGKVEVEVLTRENKNLLLSKFAKDNVEVIEIEKITPSLEEIIYKIKR